jgi:hypothetical protein
VSGPFFGGFFSLRLALFDPLLPVERIVEVPEEFLCR